MMQTYDRTDAPSPHSYFNLTPTNMAATAPPEQDNSLPTPETQSKIARYTVLDRHGQPHAFEDLYNAPDAPRRTLIIFIRHFFCGVRHLPTPFPPAQD